MAVSEAPGLQEGRRLATEVAQVQAIITPHMDAILTLFKPGAKITVFVRHPEFPDGSRDMVMTNDDLKGAAAALAKATP